MELRVLRYFLAVAREENISRAAEVLHTAQPSLSRQLKELEAELGKTLFLRGKRKITLTEDGMFFRQRAEEIIDLVDKTTRELAQGEENITGDVYIGAGETHAVHFLTTVARRMQERYPDVHYHISSGDTMDVTEALDKGLIDFGLLFHPFDMAKYHSLPIPVTDTWGVLMRRDDPLAELERIEFSRLWGKPLIVPRQVHKIGRIEQWFQDAPEPPNVAATYSLAFNGSMMAEDGLGYMLCLDKLINVEGNGNLCFRPLTPTIESGSSIVWKKYQVFSRAAAKFLELVREELSPDGKR
jgi:DNA-binding transcriptional LysR family regulator